MYDRILVPLDLSERALVAVRHADELAMVCGATLTLAHVRSAADQVLTDAVRVEGPDELGARLRALEARLEAVADSLRCRETSTVVLQGDPVQTLVKQSARFHLLVMATQGRNELKDYFLGSTAEQLVRSARCCVLVVR